MDLPSIKLNIFKKLEYFQILKEFNKQFDSQFELLKKRKWKKDEQRYEANYPTWEIEKKILFWTYMYHKHLKSGITRSHLLDMRISKEERLEAGGIKKIFENLEMRDFGEMKEKHGEDNPSFTFNKDGLSFGELLWYLYTIKKNNRNFSQKPQKYIDVYKTDFQLSRMSFGYLILQMQVFSLAIFMIFVAAILTFEILDKIGLLDNLKGIFVSFLIPSNYLLLLTISPFIIFFLSFIFDLLYRFYRVDIKYRSVEKIK